MTNYNVPLAQSTVPDYYVENEQQGTTGGKPIVRQRTSGFENTGLVPLVYDAMVIGHNVDGTVSTVSFYQGGTSGTLVGTLTLGYTSGVLGSVART